MFKRYKTPSNLLSLEIDIIHPVYYLSLDNNRHESFFGSQLKVGGINRGTVFVSFDSHFTIFLLTSNKMNSKLFSIALAVILSVSLGTAAPQTQNNNNCPSNSEWRYGNECTDSCEAHKICPMTNEYGCFCIEGHSRIDGECFPSQFCNCGLNREFRSCASWCDHMCPTDEEVICPPVCLMECSCKTGLIDVDGECLPRDEVCVE